MSKEPFNPDISNIKETEEYKKAEAAKRAIEQQETSVWQRLAHFFKHSRTRFAIGTIVLLAGVYLLLSFLSYLFGAGITDQSRVLDFNVVENARPLQQIQNAGGSVGASVSQWLMEDGVGVAAFIIVVWCLVIGWRLVHREKKVHFFTYTLITLFTIFTVSMVVGAATSNFNVPVWLAGAFGFYANKWLEGLLGIYGMIGVNIILVMLWILICYNTLKNLYSRIQDKLPRRSFDGKEIKGDDSEVQHGLSEFMGDKRKRDIAPTTDEKEPEQPAEKRKPEKKQRPEAEKKPQHATATAAAAATLKPIEHGKLTNPHDPTGEYIHYQFPTLDLLQKIEMRTDSVDREEQESNKQRIKDTLGKYGIEIKKIEVHVGPTVTLFEIIPADGVRISKIRNLEDDIALGLAALGIRIIAPMPGRGTIGIEVPNREPQVVPMREVLASKEFTESTARLPMALGCTVSNKVFVADLCKMPHLLVAGATGKGKSVGLNAIITSLLYKKGPSELKLVLVDPKRVEFSVYADLEKYFFAKVEGDDRAIVTDTEKVVRTLNSLVQEMENRYRVLEDVKVRNVEDYNRKWKAELRELRDEHGDVRYNFMPYIVCIIDEFSDMIMTAGKEVEMPIVRIAQKARAVGIHMIIATQRPSAQVITGLIKANFPGRVAFAVSQSVDSRIIIDRVGAQQLIGRGDMLFSLDGDVTRLQCPFVDTPDIVRITEYIKEQEDADKNIKHDSAYILPEYVGNDDSGVGGSADASNVKERDPLFEEAAKFIVQSDTASTSSLQRRYEIGYNRAGRIMDQMEAAGIVGPAQGGKPRKVLVSPMDVDQLFG